MLHVNNLELSRSSVWLTGSTGFIGSHIFEGLISRKIKHVTLLSSENLVRPTVSRISKQISQVLLDFENEHHLSWIDGCKLLTDPNYLILNGWGHVANPNSKTHLVENVICTEGLFNAVPKSKLQKVIYLGSIDEYGTQYGKIKESDTPIPPLSNYAIGKSLASIKLIEAAKKTKTPIQHCFVSNVYGPRQRDETLLPQLKRADSFTFSGESYYRDYIFVEDLVAVLLELLQSRASSAVNIGSGVSTHCYDFVETAWRLLGKNPSKLSFKHPELRDETMMKCFDISRLKEIMPDSLLLNDIASGLMKTVKML